MSEATWIGALLVGLLGSPHCVGMCGGFAGAAASRGRSGFAAWSVGRLTTYAALGALAGSLGRALSWLGLVGAVVSAVALFWLAARIAGVVPTTALGRGVAHGPLARLLARAGRMGPFALGMANGLLPCGLVYAALALPVVAAAPGSGAVAMLAFGLGTTPLLGAVGFGAWRMQAGPAALRRSVAVIVLLAGLWALQARSPSWAQLAPAAASGATMGAPADAGAHPSAPGPGAPCH